MSIAGIPLLENLANRTLRVLVSSWKEKLQGDMYVSYVCTLYGEHL